MDEQKATFENTLPFAEWLKSGGDLWSSFVKMAPIMPDPPSDKGSKSRSAESWKAAMKMWQSLSSTLKEPETAKALFKGIDALPDVLLKIAGATWNACFEMQKKSLERAGKIGQKVEAYQFEGIDEDLFKALKEIYDQDLRQFFNIPPLGLSRCYQERFNKFLDKFNVIQVVGAEFLSLLYLPIEKSLNVMQQKIEELAQEGKLPQESREYYDMFIRVLEGHYMILFKSPEYGRALSELFRHLSEFIICRDEVLQDMLQALPVPTYKEMDELYKELYTLKKRIKALEDQMSMAS